MHTTTLRHVDYNVKDVCADDEHMFLDEFFKDECDHNFEKTYVEELNSRVFFGK